jgi:hypothetical protein
MNKKIRIIILVFGVVCLIAFIFFIYRNPLSNTKWQLDQNEKISYYHFNFDGTKFIHDDYNAPIYWKKSGTYYTVAIATNKKFAFQEPVVTISIINNELVITKMVNGHEQKTIYQRNDEK